MKHAGQWWTFAALGSLLPLLLMWWAERPPTVDAASMVSLARDGWEWHATEPGVDPFESTSGWAPVRVPGVFSRLKSGSDGRLWLRRSFVAPPALVGRSSAVVVNQLYDLHLAARLNRSASTLIGVSTPPVAEAETMPEVHSFDEQVLRSGENTIVFEVAHSLAGVTDPQLYLGPTKEMAQWATAYHERRMLVLLSSLGFMAMLIVFVLAIRVIQATSRRRLHEVTLLLLVGGALHIARKAGLLVPATLPFEQQLLVIAGTVLLLGFALSEFAEHYLLRRVTMFGRINRIVHLIVAGLLLVALRQVYSVYLIYLFGLFVYGVVIGIRTFLKERSPLVFAVWSAQVVVMLAGLSDVLAAQGFIAAPRVFGFAVANLAGMAGTVIIAEFLEIAHDNQRLSTSLAVRADELTVALGQAQEASRAKSEFLAKTSHELRTPLNSIINIPLGILDHLEAAPRARCSSCGGRFELSAEAECPKCRTSSLEAHSAKRFELEAEEIERLLRLVAKSGNQLLAVVDDILDYSNVEAGRTVLHREPIALAAIFDEVATAVAQMPPSGVRFEVGHAPKATLDVDRLRLRQVLLNLVSNAIKFSDGRGTVRLFASEESGKVRLSVSDEGIGIASEHQALIFEGFRQVQAGHTRRFGGTGLGLALARQLVELHGGTLTVASVLGQGSTFVVELARAG